MFEGLEGLGTLVVIAVVFGYVLATFGVKLIELHIAKRRQKKYSGENDRRERRALNTGNPGHSNSTSAVELGKIDVRLENVGDKLGVFHRDFFDKHGEQTEALRDISTAIRELDTNTQGGHDRLRESVIGLQEKIDESTLTVRTMSEKVDQLRSGK